MVKKRQKLPQILPAPSNNPKLNTKKYNDDLMSIANQFFHGFLFIFYGLFSGLPIYFSFDVESSIIWAYHIHSLIALGSPWIYFLKHPHHFKSIWE